MADRIGTAVLELKTDSSAFVRDLDRAKDAAKGVDTEFAKIGKSFDQFGKNLGKLGASASSTGRSLTTSLTLPLVAIGTLAVKAGMDFEKSMNAIQGVLRPTQAQMESVRATAIKMGADTAFSATDASEAILELGKAGFDTETAISSVGKVLELAAASGLGMADSASMAARTLNAFGLEANDLGHVNDVLAKAVNATSLEIGDMQVAFGYVGPIARGFGMSIEEVSSALGIMRDSGIAAETTGRALREGFSRLANPVKAVTEVMTELGISSFTSNGKLLGLTEVVGLLESKGLTAAQSLKLFGDAAGPGMFALVQKGQKSLIDLTESLKKSDGAAKEMADSMMKGLPGAMERLKGSVETAFLSISKAIEPAVMRAADAAAGLANIITNTLAPAFMRMPGFVQVGAIAFVALAAAAGPVIWAFGTLTTATASIVGAFGTAGIATRGLALVLPWIGVSATGATAGVIALRVALAGLGIGLVITGLVMLADHIMKFQRSLDDLDPTLDDTARRMKGIKDAGGHVVMTLKEAQEAAKTAGAGTTTLGIGLVLGANAMGRFGASAAGVVPPLDSAGQSADDAAAALKKFGELKAGLFGTDDIARAKEYVRALGDIGNVSKLTIEKKEELQKAVVAALAAYKKLGQEAPPILERLRIATQGVIDATDNVTSGPGTAWGTLFRGVEDSSKEIAEIRTTMDAMASISFNQTWVPFVQGAKDGGAALDGLITKSRLMSSLKTELGSIFTSIPGTISQALVAGGGLGNAASAIASQLGSNLAKKLAATLGVAGPVGQAIAGALGALAPMISKLWGGNAEHKKVNDLRDAFVSAAGGIHSLNVKAQAAGLTLDRLLRAKNVKDYEAAIAELNAAFERQGEILAENTAAASGLFDDIMSAGSEGIPAAYRPAIEQLIALGLLTDEQAAKLRGMADATGPGIAKMESAMGTLKGRIESLGPAFRQAKINETAMTYANAIQTLIDGGGDVGGVLFDAREELGELVEESLKSKTTLPANLKPWIDDLVASGNLIDASGAKITDVSGLKFGEPMKTEAEKSKEGWDKIIAAIDALIARIDGPLTRSIQNIPDRTIRVGVDVDDPDGLLNKGDDRYRSPNGNREPGDFAEGVFRGKFGAAGRLARLHNIESVVPKRGEMAFASRVLAERGLSTTTNTNTSNILPILMGQGMSAYEIGRAAARYLAESGLPLDTAGVATSVERVVENWMRSYATATR